MRQLTTLGCLAVALLCSSVPGAVAGSEGDLGRTGAFRLHLIASRSVPVDGAPLGVSSGALWSASSHGLVRIALPKLKVSVVVKTPIDDLAVHQGDVYALSRSARRLFRVNSRTGKVTRRWRLRADPHSLAVSGGSLYVDFNSSPDGVEQINLASGSERFAKLPTAASLSQDQSLAAERGAVWVLADRLYRVDAKTLRVARSVAAPATDDVWFGDGSLWLASEQPNGGIYRLDPTSGQRLAHDSADAIQLAFSPGVVWAAAAAGPTALDAKSAKRVAALPSRQVPSQGSAGIAIAGDTLWVTYGDIGKLQEIHISR